MAKINIPCIPADVVEQIKREDLSVNSEKRETLFKKYLTNEDAKNFNILFERSKLLKNQELAFNRLINDVTGLSKEKRARVFNRVQENLQRKRELLFNADGSVNQNFEAMMRKTTSDWEDFTRKALEAKHGIEIPEEVIARITKLKRKLSGLTEGTEEWGVTMTKLSDEIDNIKNPTNKLGFLDSIKHGFKETQKEINASDDIAEKIGIRVKSTADVLTSEAYRAIKATFDFSGFLNQGYKILLDNPSNWAKSVVASVKTLKKFGKKEVIDVFHVRLASDVDFKAGIDNGLRIGGLEEYFKDTLFSKIPYVGRIIKASDNIFTVFVQTARFNIFKSELAALKEISLRTGEKISKEALADIAEVANSITGSGSLGKLEKNIGIFNKLLFAPRYIKSSIDTLTMPFKLKKFNKVARTRAAKLLIKNIATLGTFYAASAIFFPDSMVISPKSPKFGKVRIKDDKWIGVGGAVPSYVTFLWRVLGGVTENASGKVTKLNTDKYGSKTRGDVLFSFFKNKAAPVPSVIISAWVTGKNYKGDKYNYKDIPDSLLTPIAVENIFEMAQTDPDTLEAILLGISEMAGLSSTNFDRSSSDAKAPIRAGLDVIFGK